MNVKYVFMFALAAGCTPLAPPKPSPLFDASDSSTMPVDASVVFDASADVKPAATDASTLDSPSPPADESTACAAMKIAGCQEGKIPTCPRVLKLINDDYPQIGHFDVVCITAVKTIAEVKACGAQCTP